MTDFFASGWFNYLVLPAAIFFARICDVTIGTLRIIFVSKGNKIVAPVLGFFEVLIWIIAITRIIENLNNPFCYVAYAAGFATGNYIGLRVEEKLAVGIVLIRIITSGKTDELMQSLHSGNIGATIVDAGGSQGKVNIILTIVQRTRINDVLGIIMAADRNAFYTVEDIRMVNRGIFPGNAQASARVDLFRRWRRGI